MNGAYFALNKKSKQDSIYNTLDTIIDEYVTNLHLGDYANYDEMVKKMLSILNIDINAFNDIDNINTLMLEDSANNKENDYQKLLSFIVIAINIIGRLSKVRAHLTDTNNKIISVSKRIDTLKNNWSRTPVNQPNKKEDYINNIEILKNQIQILSQNITIYTELSDKEKIEIGELKKSIGRSYKGKNQLSRPLTLIKKDIEATEESYLLLVDNNVGLTELANNLKNKLDRLYITMSEMLTSINGYELNIKEASKQKSEHITKLQEYEANLHKYRSNSEKLKRVLKTNEEKLNEIEKEINTATSVDGEIANLSSKFKSLYEEKVRLEKEEIQEIIEYRKLFVTCGLHDSVLFDVNDILAEITMLYEQVDRLGESLGFKSKSIINAINNMDFIQQDGNVVKYIDYSPAYNKFFFNHKFLSIFGELSEYYISYKTSANTIVQSISSDSYNAEDIAEGIDCMAMYLFNIFFNKNNQHSLCNIGLISKDDKYNIQIMRDSNKLLSSLVEHCRKTIIRIALKVIPDKMKLDDTKVTELFSKVTKILKDKT